MPIEADNDVPSMMTDVDDRFDCRMVIRERKIVERIKDD
jgi:hypothetical protein